MFVDLVNSSAWASGSTPRTCWRSSAAIANSAAPRSTAIGGHIARLVGDGILAYFCYPVANENDPERARARGAGHHARHRRPRHAGGRSRCNVRIGIATGRVIVSDLFAGGEDRRRSSARRRTSRPACKVSRPTDGIVIAERDPRPRRRTVRLRRPGRREVRGFASTHRVWRVLGEAPAPRADFEPPAAVGSPRSMVARPSSRLLRPALAARLRRRGQHRAGDRRGRHRQVAAGRAFPGDNRDAGHASCISPHPPSMRTARCVRSSRSCAVRAQLRCRRRRTKSASPSWRRCWRAMPHRSAAPCRCLRELVGAVAARRRQSVRCRRKQLRERMLSALVEQFLLLAQAKRRCSWWSRTCTGSIPPRANCWSAWSAASPATRRCCC